jgi:murein L,D-transpeptidase YcbB/YkuD
MRSLFLLVALLSAAPLAAAPGDAAPATESLLWVRDGKLTRSALALLAEMRDAEKYGLRPGDYSADALLARATRPLHGADALGLDGELSRSIARFVTHLHAGRIAPRSVGYDLDVPHSTFDATAAVRALAASATPLTTLAGYEPEFHHYRLLIAALRHYRAMAAAAPEPPPLPPLGAPSIKPGEAYAGMRALRSRLAQLGDLEASALKTQSDDRLDAVTAMALVRFQVRHRLDVDGALGRATRDALDVPLARRIRQLEFSIERSRWLPSRLVSPLIIVNIPQFELFAFHTASDREQDLLIMDVVVGKVFPQNNTPVFVADMNQVVFRPYWDVPRSILLQELLPQIRAHADWVDRNGFEIVRGQGDDGSVVPQSAASIAGLASGALRLRQKPGATNALGNAKFLFPNRYNVYLHDTPSQGVFAQARRAASHGCVRVADPEALARYALRNQPGWTNERITAAMHAPTGTRVMLREPIRVYMFYATAIALEDGRVLFFEDLYHHDEKLAKVW